MGKARKLRQRQIEDAWDKFEDADPDTSTERLLAMIEDETGADAGDISGALYKRHLAEQGEND